MVVPVEPRGRRSDGRCVVRLLGIDLVMRCGRDEPPRGHALACLRTGDLFVAGEGEPALPGRVTRMIYQAGHFRVEMRPDADPGMKLVLREPEPARFSPGDSIRIGIRDGWIIPARNDPAEGGAPP